VADIFTSAASYPGVTASSKRPMRTQSMKDYEKSGLFVNTSGTKNTITVASSSFSLLTLKSEIVWHSVPYSII